MQIAVKILKVKCINLGKFCWSVAPFYDRKILSNSLNDTIYFLSVNSNYCDILTGNCELRFLQFNLKKTDYNVSANTKSQDLSHF